MRKVLVAVILGTIFFVGFYMYCLDLSSDAPKAFGIAGVAGVSLMIFSTAGGFISMVLKRATFKSNFDRGLMLCTYGAITAFIPTLIQAFMANRHVILDSDLQLIMSIHMIFFTTIAFASAGAGGSLIAADIVLNKEP
ncbi:MAG: hypothetical protein AB1780_08320 [Pseudomonadota bacterium]|uniref:hypothetical protein n=1 Tax=Rheinheimera nanhaiensis TaxID=1163621 RepID=UPI00058E748A|nr:hypothetical protein [Rheinheimera nanhaiensis]